jgi:hypothetical protein
MSGNSRILNARAHPFLRQHVAVADAAGLYFDAYLSVSRLRDLPFHDLEIPSRL